MTARTRSRAKTSQGKQSIAPSGSNPTYTNTEYSETCQDVIRDYPRDHSLLLDRTVRSVQPFSGNTKTSITDTTFAHSYDNYWPTYPRTTTVNHQVVAGVPSDNEIGISTLAKTNPSKPSIDVLLFLYELKDLPMLARQVHMNLNALKFQGKPPILRWTQTVAGNVLSFEFGIKPLIKDLQALVSFQKEVDQKVRLLERLYNNGGLRTKIRPVTNSTFSRVSVTCDSSAGIIPATIDRITSVSKWGSVRWTPDPSKPRPTTDAQMLDLARRAVFGRDLSLDSLWNAVPYSWMVDWFSNANEFLSSFRNTVPCIHSNVCVMTHTKTSYSGKVDRSSYPYLKGGDFDLTRETKSRVVMPFLLPEAHLSFLDGRQVSILGSLGITRIPRDILK